MKKLTIKIWVDDRQDENDDEGMNYWGKESLFVNPECEYEVWFRGDWRIIEKGILYIDGDIFRGLPNCRS